MKGYVEFEHAGNTYRAHGRARVRLDPGGFDEPPDTIVDEVECDAIDIKTFDDQWIELISPTQPQLEAAFHALIEQEEGAA